MSKKRHQDIDNVLARRYHLGAEYEHLGGYEIVRKPDAGDPDFRMTDELSFGRYQLVMEMARGGMATLFLARLQGPAMFEKLVVIKKIHEHLAKERVFIDMFMDEARITALINHTNVASVFDLGQQEGVYFLAMEYVHGHNLLEILKSSVRHPGVVTWPLAARIVAEAAAGLHAAHELKSTDGTRLNVVHRDVSPSNILVSYAGQVKVVDFGIALASQRLTSTTTGTLKGKVAYMSPEQVSNDLVTKQSDIFSLGIVLYETTTGRRLFKANSDAASIKLICETQIPSPRSLNPEIPGELEQIILKALARDPAERYSSAGAFEEALEQQLAAVGKPTGRRQLTGMMDKLFHDLKKVKDEQIRLALEGRAQGSPMKGVAMGSRQTSSSTVMNMSSATKAGRRPGRFIPWLAAGGGILVAAIVLGYVILGGTKSSRDDVPKGEVTGSAKVTPDAKPQPVRLGERPGETVRIAPTSAGMTTPAKVKVQVTVLPRKASVVTTFRGLHYRGNTFRVVVPRTKSPERLEIRAAGYRTRTLKITATADIEQTITLRRLPPRRRRPPRRRTAADWVMGI